MSYQVNLHNNTSVYVNKNDEANIFAAKASETEVSDRDTGSVQAGTKADEGLMQALSGDEAYTQATSTQVMKNTEQYMEMLEKNGATSGCDDLEDEEEARERKREIYKNLSSEEIAKLKMMQVDLSTVSLSDIAGLVAGIRNEANQQEFNQRIADICDGVDAVRGDISHRSLKEALKSMLPEEMDGLTIDSVLEEDYQIREQQMIYLLKNELQLTIANLYKSEYATSSGFYQGQNPLSDEELQSLMPQIDAVFAQSGLDASSMTRDDLMAASRFLISREISLTPEALRNYAAILDINSNGMNRTVLAANMLTQKAAGCPVADANVYFNQKETAEHLVEMVSEIAPEAIAEAEQQDKALTIRNLASLTRPDGVSGDDSRSETDVTTNAYTEADEELAQLNVLEQMSKAEITARRQLEEIRLSMTQSAAIRLVMSDIHIDTKELSEVVKKLYEMEQAMAKETFADYDTVYSDEAGVMYQETMHKVAGLKLMPASILTIAVRPEPLTIPALYEEGINQALKSYETMMTAPRSDMGDSISKAFDNMDSLLQEMGIAPEEENRRAVKILSYNQMEITESTIALIKDADTRVNQMLRGMTPRAVLELIRNRQNPLEMSVDELNEALAASRGDDAVNEDERFSQFLYKLEQRHDISEEEKQSFIGIYRLLDKVQKHSGRDIGFVVKTGGALTLKNLLSAHRSNQAKGIDFAASDETGMLESVTVDGVSISEQIESAFQTYGEPVMEQVFEEMQKEMPEAYAEELYAENRDMEFSEEAEIFAAENEITYTQGNMAAIDAMLADEAGIYGMVKTWLAKSKAANIMDTEYTNAAAGTENIEEESGSEATDVEIAEADIDSMFARVTEHFEDSETVRECYDALSQSLTDVSYQGILTHQDIQALKQIHTGFSILKKMSAQENYQVPLKVDGKWTVLNVRFQNMESVQEALQDTDVSEADSEFLAGGQQRNGISINMRHERYGNISASIFTGEEDGGQIQTEHAGVMEWPEHILAKAEQALTKEERYALAKELFVILSKL